MRPRNGCERRCDDSRVAAELAARISEECFDFLEDPVIRIAGEDIPISVSPLLETNSVPPPT